MQRGLEPGTDQGLDPDNSEAMSRLASSGARERLRVLLPFPGDAAIDALRPARIYCVGGAVRDALLGRTVHERDWVVVGSTPELMHRAGFRPVGKDFPVFLHRQSGEEYALARTERKTGRGYHGFQFHCHPGVSLHDDLQRRDLRINAMALDADGGLFDPCAGISDLEDGWLHHVSDAFREDPVRILRVARFTASLPGFRVHPDTEALMREMVRAGETEHWVAERIWRELERGMLQALPSAMWRCLKHTEAEPFSGLGPEHAAMLAGIDRAARESAPSTIRWGIWGALAGEAFADRVRAFVRMPREVTSIVELGASYLDQVLDATEAMIALERSRADAARGGDHPFASAADALVESLGRLFERIDVLRRPGRLETLLAIAALHPRLGSLDDSLRDEAIERLREAAAGFASPSVASLDTHGGPYPVSGPQLASLLRTARRLALGNTLLRRYA
jgi:tRNA nucleotidyltransferase (CCA-adding enzyme)